MVQPIMKDVFFLTQKSLPATKEDLPIAEDLMDTLIVNQDRCAGMAANMIGKNKRIIAFAEDGGHTLMLNPEIIKKSLPYHTEEGCLSLEGKRPAKRYQSIKVKYQTIDFQVRLKTYTGWTAQVIQHEIDHLEGILI